VSTTSDEDAVSKYRRMSRFRHTDDREILEIDLQAASRLPHRPYLSYVVWMTTELGKEEDALRQGGDGMAVALTAKSLLVSQKSI
jgi:hypothetical protein